MTLVYIAAPYTAHPGLTTTENIVRAHTLARHALSLGYAPIVIHGAIQAGVYGNDDVPAERAIGIETACAIAAGVGRAGGELWALMLPYGAMSDGVDRERRAYLDAGGRRTRWFKMAPDLSIREI